MELLRPDAAVFEAALAGPEVLSEHLGVQVADGWEGFPEAIAPTRDALRADPVAVEWGPRLFVAGEPRTLVGLGGFKGPPAEGAVEVGYAIAPACQGRGLASAALAAMLREAFAQPAVTHVLAHTLAERNASVRVLEKAGFRFDGDEVQPVGAVWRWRLERSPGALQ